MPRESEHLVGKRVRVTVSEDGNVESGVLVYVTEDGGFCLEQWSGEHGRIYGWPALKIEEVPHA